ncbi:S41 family peptidase [Corallococcus llansteffanensis]|uniref:Peptidase S41 n=1 Tax=Corallococcus llansteffanensis TaxID=2316731 RepID=A0A3A8QFB2_9BACT|nr:S41 family peptidase [Corallococcus llansteffanensis]RKH63552.1 peptidase S41 [Corallococcus llansteffanensis]
MKPHVIASLIALSCFCTTALAQPRLSPKERVTALRAISTEFEKRYVFPELRPKIIERLNQLQKAGRYDVDDPLVFAERLTGDLRSVSNDRHLSLRVDPAAYAAALAAPDSDAGEEAYFRRQAIRDHHGLAEMRILPGNIRYLKITGFQWTNDASGTAYDDAMRFLKDGDAIIIDLRNNGGGSHGAVRYLVSHFLDPDTLELTFLQGSETPSQSRSLEHLPAGRLKGKPLYVLIDGQTASAAEAFAYDVQQFKLGVLVGARTVGAANNNTLLPIAPHFILSVSYGRPVHAVSKTNWEGAGVAPDVETPSAQALDAAQMHALRKLSQTPGATPEQLGDYRWANIAVEARMHPVSLDPAMLAPLAGRYLRSGAGAAPVKVTHRDGALWFAFPDLPVARLSPLTKDVFAVEGYEVLRVRLTGKTLEMLWRDEPAPRVYPRE